MKRKEVKKTVNISRSKYKEAPACDWIIFTDTDQSGIHPALAGRIAYMCSVKKKKVVCTRGKTSYEDQVAVIKSLKAANPTWIIEANGALYNGSKCMASAPGSSNHEPGHAADLSDWAKEIDNDELAEYGLRKPMSYEPWHYQLLETKGQTKAALQANWKEWCSKMVDIEKAQSAMASIGLYTGKVDGDNGPKTKAGAKELIAALHTILGTDYKAAEEVIKATQSSPDYWIGYLSKIKFFDQFVMNIVNKMKGK